MSNWNNQDLQGLINPFIRKGPNNCNTCGTHVLRVYHFLMPPPLLVFDTANCRCIINQTLLIRVGNNNFRYHLAGIIYFGNEHFTCRIIHENNVWFHDGYVNEAPINHGPLNDLSNLYYHNTKTASAVFYVLSS